MNETRDLANEIARTDPWIKAITVERMTAALDGFRLRLASDWDFQRFTEAIQDRANSARVLSRQGDSSARKELEKFAMKADALRRGIERMGQTAQDAAFFDLLYRTGNIDGAGSIDQDDYRATMIDPLELIANVLARAASQIATQRPQSPRWTEKERQESRVGFAIALIPIFEEAFDTPARANNWRSEYGDEHAWPEFYRRIYLALFPGAKRLNLAAILQEASRELPSLLKFQRWLDEEDAIRRENIGK